MSSDKKAQSLIILPLVATLGIVAATLHGRGQGASTSTLQDEPTPVQRGQFTQRQREHGKLFKNKGVGNIPDLIMKGVAEGGSGDINIESLPGLPELSPSGEASQPSDILTASAARADAVVIGVVSGKTSQLNETETFVFTDYDVSVVEVLKNNSPAPVIPDSTMTVARAGGTVRLEGHVIRAVDRTARPLQVGGKYLLFLRYIPATGAYLSTEGANSFELKGGQVLPLTEDPLYSDFQKGKDTVSFINDVHAAIAKSNERKER